MVYSFRVEALRLMFLRLFNLSNLFLAMLGLHCFCAGFLWLQRAGAALELWRAGFSCCGSWALECVGSGAGAPRLWSTGSVVVVCGLSCSLACGIFLDPASNPGPLHWQEESYLLYH